MNGDPSKLAEGELERLGVRPLPASLEEALGALESDGVVRSWFFRGFARLLPGCEADRDLPLSKVRSAERPASGT